MAQVLVRGLEDEVVSKLKKRAEQNNRSLQEELQVILACPAASADAADVERMDAGMRRNRARKASPDSVWNWLEHPSAGKLSKKDVDGYIRRERRSWRSS